MPEDSKLNPVVRTTTIGVRVMREISIFPLSVTEQLNLTDLITKTLQEFFKADGGSKTLDVSTDNIEFVSFVVELIKTNVAEIIELVTEEEKDLLDDMTNEQLVDFAEVIYEMNFEVAKKKLAGLIKRIMNPPEDK